jgi:hypothetical protein
VARYLLMMLGMALSTTSMTVQVACSLYSMERGREGEREGMKRVVEKEER